MPEKSLATLLETTPIAGLPVVRTDGPGLAAQLLADWQAQVAARHTLPPKLVFSVNGQGIALWHQNAAYKALMAQADYRHADGQSVVFASRLLTRAPITARSATTDFFHDAATLAEAHGLRFYFLGAKEENNLRAVAKALELHPRLQVAGRQHGYFDKGGANGPNAKAWAPVIADIKASKADVVWLAFGKPKQEEICAWLQPQLTGVTWLKPCGGLFEFLAGDKRAARAPRWMQQAGLEWLFRLAQDPKRLLWRYAVTNIVAIWAMLTGR